MASSSGISLDTWRKLEHGEVPTPGFFLVADMADALQVTLDDLVQAARQLADREEDA
jgi:transcriptional regulator with XRE-family HTH domain